MGTDVSRGRKALLLKKHDFGDAMVRFSDIQKNVVKNRGLITHLKLVLMFQLSSVD
jgi:hypothetical protein